jgi:hypothetical protein
MSEDEWGDDPPNEYHTDEESDVRVGDLVINAELGEGHVLMSDTFDEIHPLMCADVLGDWIGQLIEIYEERYGELKDWMKGQVESDTRTKARVIPMHPSNYTEPDDDGEK